MREETNQVAETGKKRGRPPTNPYIEAIIVGMVRAEELEPPEKRMLPKVLAAVILRRIEAEILNNPRLKGERAPRLGTIEKRVLRYRKQGRLSDEDKPWSLASLADERHQIPAEAVSTIVRLWVWMLDEEGLILSVREAKWAARLYAAINEGVARWNAMPEKAVNVWSANSSTGHSVNPLHMISLYARAYATSELIAEILNRPLDMGASFDATLWTLLTGEQPKPELDEKIYRRPEPDIQIRTTENGWAAMRERTEWLPRAPHLELYAIGEKGIEIADKTGGQSDG